MSTNIICFVSEKLIIMQKDIRPLGITLGALKGIFPRLVTIHLKNRGIEHSFEQVILLMVVNRCERKHIVQQDIAELLGKDKSVVLRMIDQLEKKNILERTTDPNDRRRNIITITQGGYQLIETFQEIEQIISNELLDGLSDDELQAFYKVINHIKVKADSLKDNDYKPCCG